MAEEIKITLKGDKEVEAAVEKLGEGIRPAVKQAMNSVVQFLKTYIKSKKLSGDPLRVRSGRLRSSVTSQVFEIQGGILGRVGTNVEYARAHEFGAHIRPKRAKYLTIPLAGAKTRAGVARGNARSFGKTFVIMSRAGNLIIMGKPTPGAQKDVPLFVLKRSVDIKKRPFMIPAVMDNKKNIVKIFNQSIVALANNVKQ